MSVDYLTEYDIADTDTEPDTLVECAGCPDILPDYLTVRVSPYAVLCRPCHRETTIDEKGY